MTQELKAAIASFFRTSEIVMRSGKMTETDSTLAFRSKIVPGDPTANLLGVSEHVMNKELKYVAPLDGNGPVKASIVLSVKDNQGMAKEVSQEIELTEDDGVMYDKVKKAVELQVKAKKMNYIEREALEDSEMTLVERQKISFATIEKSDKTAQFFDFPSSMGKHGFFNFSESGTNAVVVRHLEKMLGTSEVKFEGEGTQIQVYAEIQKELSRYREAVDGVVGRFHQMLKDENREQEEISKLRKNQGTSNDNSLTR